MTILYQDLHNLIPFRVDSLIDISRIKIIADSPVNDQFVHKEEISLDIINKDFLNFLNDKGISISKAIVWHWLCKNPHWAHIDCDSNGEILSWAINWTVNNNKSCVNFYDLPNVDKTVRFGNEIDTDWKTDNVTSYIPVNVKNISPTASWDSRGPALINTSVPHLIVAPEMRTSISLSVFQTSTSYTIDEVFNKFLK